MTCGNPVKHKLQKAIDNWLDMFTVERKLSDEQMECMQFGICDYAPRQVEEVPFFHYWILIARVKRLFNSRNLKAKKSLPEIRLLFF